MLEFTEVCANLFKELVAAFQFAWGLDLSLQNWVLHLHFGLVGPKYIILHVLQFAEMQFFKV